MAIFPGSAAPVAEYARIISWSRERVPQGCHDVATARRGAPTSRAPDGMRCTARTAIQLNTSVPANTTAALITAKQRRARQRKLQPRDEVIVHQIKAVGIGGQATVQPRIFGGEMQTAGDRQNAVDDDALDARRADAGNGGPGIGVACRPQSSVAG
jgi:hypothetical protein